MSALPWITLFVPLVSAVVITILTRRLPKLSAAISVAAVLVSFAGSCVIFFWNGPFPPREFLWIDLRPHFQVPIGFTIDQLSKTMLLVVTGIGALIHIYSLGYMRDDDGKARYFAGLSLFIFSMLGIVLANNFIMMFIFWELVGVSSYILIGHWFTRPAPPMAANKAFVVNRIGDFGFMLGILMLWVASGSVLFTEIEEKLPILGMQPVYLTAATLLIFCGAVGKSAQFPLHVWLPDAMEGPTPVSALIHAATMVAAGVYMLARIFFLIEASETVQDVIAWIGTITALMAALMATQQKDIKRILAYSTISQLAFMIMAIGLAASAAAMFHLFTHAFFKALLFLGAGAVIHALHHEQDIWKMGGLKNQMPITFLTFLLGTLAISGCPLFSGFFSKDTVLLAAYHENLPIFILALFTAFLTSFYMFRLFVVVFLGAPRSDGAKHGYDAPAVMTVPLILLAIPSVIAGYPFLIRHFVSLPAEETHGWAVPLLATAAFLLGAVVAFALYTRRAKDPVEVPLFVNRFYIDDFYRAVMMGGQDFAAKLSAWFDRWVLDGLIVRGTSALAWGTGFVLRLLQVGNLQAYALLFAAGVIALIYFIVFT
jgi:NADH-quinone oxidoreductase subunit L